jgi:hypothetical protein
MNFALREQVATKRSGKDVWYRFWTQIGPCCTSDPKQRALLKSREEWRQSRAMLHSLSFFEIVELPDDCEGDLDWNKP